MADYNIKIDKNKVIFDGHAENPNDCHTLTLLCNLLQENTKTIDYQSGYAEFELEDTPSENRFWASSNVCFYINGARVNIVATQIPVSDAFIRVSIAFSVQINDNGIIVTNTSSLSTPLRVGCFIESSEIDVTNIFSKVAERNWPVGESCLFPFADGIKIYSITASDGTPINKGDKLTSDAQLSVTYVIPCANSRGITLKTEGKRCHRRVKVIPKLQEKSVTENGDVVPDSGYAGISKISVAVPTPETQEKTATPSTTQQEITPDDGKVLSKVTVGAIQTETKSVTPGATAQDVTPTSGKYLTKVSVGAVQTETKSVTANGTYTPTSGKFFAKVTVNVPTPSPTLQAKTVKPTTAQQDVTPDTGYDGMSKVTVSAIQTETKTVTANGTYTPGTGKDGFSSFTVDVPQAEPIEVSTAAAMNALLVAGNVGKVYKFTGTTDSTYTNGDLYEVVSE